VILTRAKLMPDYARLVYNGFWFAPERLMMQAAIDEAVKPVTGTARLRLYKGNCITVGRKAPVSLYDTEVASFEDDGGAYNQADAEGFIKLNALRLRVGSKHKS